MLNNAKYFVIYDDSKKGYTLFVKNDIFDVKTREQIVESYNKAVEEAKQKEASK